MAKFIDADRLLQKLTTINSTVEQGIKYYNSVYNLVNEQPAADVVEVEKAAKILVDVTGKAPCEMVGANDWDCDCCNCVELCSQSTYEQCWERYFKHYKERSEGDGKVH